MAANDTIDLSAGYVKAPPAAGAIDLSAGYVKSQPSVDLSAGYIDNKPAPPPPTPPADQSYIQAGPPTPQPWVSPEQGPKPGTGATGGKDWLMDALTAPGTFLGRMFQPFKEPSKEEKYQERVSGQPAVGNLPLIDPSIGMEPTFIKGVVKGMGGLTAPNQLPLALFSPESKAVSGLFAAMVPPQLAAKAAQYHQLKAAGKDSEANVVVGEMATIGTLGTLATFHAAGGGERLSTLTKDEQTYLTDALTDHYTQSIGEELKSGQPKLSEVPPGVTESEGLPTGGQPPTRDQGAAPPLAQEGGVQTLRDDTGITRGEGPPKADALLSPIQSAAGGPSPEGVAPPIERRAAPSQETEIIRRLMIEETIKMDEQAIASTTDPAEKARITEHMNDFKDMLVEPGSEAEGGVLERKISQLSTIFPDFTKAIGGERGGEEGAATTPESAVAGATGTVEPELPPPVISRATDSDLADHGVQVIRPGDDIGKVQLYGGAMTETARLLNQQGHPLGPMLTSLARTGVDAIKNMAKATIDTLGGWKRNAKVAVSDKEWSEQVVPLLRDEDVTIRTRPPDIPNNIWKAYTNTRPMLDTLRINMRDAIRQRLHLVGLPAKFIAEKVPDDWGIPFGYYPGIFEGDYAITKLINIDEKGNENWQPIETGWRDTSEAKAIKKAADYMQANPGTRVQVKKDTYTLPGKDFSSRAKLIDLAKKLKVTDNADLEELVGSLYDEAAAAAYGPTRIAPRQYGHALQRRVDLPGGATDMESFERFIMGSIRFIHLTPAREAILTLRNKMADISGMPEIQRPSDIPASIAYSHASQYGNIMARTDHFIDGVEGRPGFSDVELRSALNSIGADPSFMSRVSRATQELTALLKLGFNGAKVLSHGLQSLWAGFPVLGSRYALEGYLHAYNPLYSDLIRSIAPSEPRFNPIVGGLEAIGNVATWTGSPNTLVDAIHNYKADYFSRGTGPIDWGKGLYSLARDIGMSPFAAGIETTRRMGAVGSFRKAIDRGLPEAQARSAASADVDRISGLYHAADNPVALRQLPGPIAQFKTFSFKTAQMMYGFRTPAEWTYFLGAISLLGYAGLPFLKPLSGIAMALSGEDVENDIKRKFPVVSRGIFGAAGVDIPPGVGVGDLGLTRPQAPLGGILGPAGTDIYSLAKGGAEKLFKPESREADQDLRDAIRNLSPALRRLLDEGARNASNPSTIDPHTGSTILEHLTSLERLESAIGFTPLRVAEERESHEYVRNLIEQEKDKRGYFVDRMAANALELSRHDTTPDRQAAIIKETIALGRLAGEYGVGAHLGKAVIERAKDMEYDRLTRDILKAPKAVRPQIYEEMQRFKQQQEEQ